MCHTDRPCRLLASATAFFASKSLAVDRVAECADDLQEFSAAAVIVDDCS